MKKNKSKKFKALFVCTGNTCRSPMAEIIVRTELKKRGKAEEYAVSSAGLCADGASPIAKNANAALKAFGIAPSRRRSKLLTPAAVKRADAVICMSDAHKNAVRGLNGHTATYGEIAGGGDVPDPYGGDLDRYKQTAGFFIRTAPAVVDYLEKMRESTE
ncbi:MAG: low molecular weight protein arginine phosphatase [Clostridiales bacterium]|jgi:protein-tyrosine phosphatase|nr:low molecular weight protein arginine phosphatase [Clostridiales bacterium]